MGSARIVNRWCTGFSRGRVRDGTLISATGRLKAAPTARVGVPALAGGVDSIVRNTTDVPPEGGTSTA
jgi:hypothetical protein